MNIDHQISLIDLEKAAQTAVRETLPGMEATTVYVARLTVNGTPGILQVTYTTDEYDTGFEDFDDVPFQSADEFKKAAEASYDD